jgi:hypothetical protein
MNKQPQKQIIENYIKSYNSFHVEGMLRDLHENVIFENFSDDKVNLRTKGLLEFKKQAESAIKYFKERKQNISLWKFQDNKVIINIDFSAIPAIDLPNGIKAGVRFDLHGQSEFTFEGQKIILIRDIS